MKQALALLTALFSVSMAYTQAADSQWMFGYGCWLDFTSSPVTDIGDGHIQANEGVTSISDAQGNILFTTDGSVVYDRSGDLMQNGSGLGGHPSSTAGAIIVPKPGDKEARYYYIFTVTAEAGNYDPAHTGLEYVLVDMQANAGLGAVIGSSVELVPNTGEKIHATWHSNQRDVWVVTHSMDDDAYHAILVDCEGVHAPVLSHTGRIHQSTEYGQACTGALKISPDGNRIAVNYNGPGTDGPSSLINYLEHGYFNNLTGQVQIIDEVFKDMGTAQGYGLEFSPNSQVLYWTIMAAENTLFQYDLQAPDLVSGEYQFTLPPSGGHALGAMQSAPDGRIYMARTHNGQYLSAIAQPDVIGEGAGFIDEAVALSRPCRFGLPNHWMAPYPPVYYENRDEQVEACEGEPFQLVAPQYIDAPYLWSTGHTGAVLSREEFDTYWVTASACDFDTAFFFLEEPEYCDCQLYVPNSFTPDGDGLNDSFGVSLWCEVDDFIMEIYDRWGQVVFQSEFPSLRWDGGLNGYYLPDGIYTWTVRWTDYQDGVPLAHREQGSVTLLR